jgi:hypothetical protein
VRRGAYGLEARTINNAAVAKICGGDLPRIED